MLATEQRLHCSPKCCPVSYKLNLYSTAISDRHILRGRLKLILPVKWPNVVLALGLK